MGELGVALVQPNACKARLEVRYPEMKLRVGYEFDYLFPQPTPCLLMLNIHHTRVGDITKPDHAVITPSTLVSGYSDLFGNWGDRVVAPAGSVRIAADAVVRDNGDLDLSEPMAGQFPVE